MKKILIFSSIVMTLVIMSFVTHSLMTLRDHLNVQTQSELYNFTLVDGQAVSVYGVSSMGDIPIKFYYYDVNSSAADDGENVIKPTSITGNGRFLKIAENVPIGVINAYAGDIAPVGFLLCQGQTLSRTTYSQLFSVCDACGAGDGSTTFTLPDMQQRFPLGKGTSGTGSSLGETGGSIDHIHVVDPPGTSTGLPSTTVQATILLGGAAGTDHTHVVDVAQFNSEGNNPSYLTLNYIIKY